MFRFWRPVIAGLALVALLIPVVPAAVSASDSVQARHDRVVAYWTPARMKAAIPRGVNFIAHRKPVPSPSPDVVTGASWTGGGLVLQATGKVYFQMGGSGWICSGSIARDTRSGYSLVLTAGHCAYDQANLAFATNWMFIPEFDSAPTYTCANTTWGCWVADALVVNSGFAYAGGFNSQATVNDFAFAVVSSGGKSGTQLDTLGSFPIAFSGVKAGDKLYAFGYPASGKYKGKDLTYCAGPIFTDASNSNLTWGMACDMTGGSSGGPWFSSFDTSTGSGTLSSLNSYGYSGVKNMYGPKFGTATQAVYNAANSATSNTIVP